MLYTDAPQIVFTFDPADGRYALSHSLSRSTPAYTLSCGRGEPYTPSHPTPSTSTPTFQPSYPIHAISSTPTMEGRSHLKYPVLDMRETRPGVLATGHWTANHPLVDAYLAALERLAPRQRPQQAPRALSSLPPTAAASPVLTPHARIDAHVSSPPATHAYAAHSDSERLRYASYSEDERLRWRAQQGGIASVCTVAQVITVQYELFPGPGSAWYAAQVPRLSEEQKQVVFALAALRVLNHPTHPAHWALWAKNVLRRTAQVVEDVLQLNPCPIVSPVGWLGLPESIWALHGLQSSFIPPPPQPEKPKTGGMTLRKRKATAAASNNAAEEEVTLRVSPRKRQRTTRAQAALAQAEVPPPVLAPTSMLLDIPATSAVAADAGATSKAMKQDLLDVDVSRTSPALQPLAPGGCGGRAPTGRGGRRERFSARSTHTQILRFDLKRMPQKATGVDGSAHPARNPSLDRHRRGAARGLLSLTTCFAWSALTSKLPEQRHVSAASTPSPQALTPNRLAVPECVELHFLGAYRKSSHKAPRATCLTPRSTHRRATTLVDVVPLLPARLAVYSAAALRPRATDAYNV
ncbi:hypothetical protein C2E23DRAFT_886527 [Lenzites betulinus]|nr:hypothetical protein C2E23DRAFT_886527 [Lenzites betulinus]